MIKAKKRASRKGSFARLLITHDADTLAPPLFRVAIVYGPRAPPLLGGDRGSKPREYANQLWVFSGHIGDSLAANESSARFSRPVS